ncbi:biotin transporter BioY [Paenibacillus sp. TRM 82003]|uniref:biotin transporter BioY n=1 Tax=Kineococcus sp. TRM81007 TaxID=2925831 RepID=UPI001F57C201|nr:biotin transporter BioY [Kineococcus sp. TRM81007]MCI2237647.1 biotin transporter BioY [Kineococcus sp. TRM81007]MCI3921664.1 biotin transporter BioY [Paenibacillus sp. TRM 82003]
MPSPLHRSPLRRSSLRTTAAPATDGVRRPAGRTGDLALVAVFAALVAALALMPALPTGPVGVPITLQTLGLMLCGAVLGPWRGALAALVYLLMGLAGLPVFAGGAAGLAVLAGPSAGFLLAYPAGALVTGALARAGARRGAAGLGCAAGCLLGGIAVVHAGGVPGMALAGGLSLTEAAWASLRYVPGDLVKLVVAVVVAAAVHRASPRLLLGR